MSRYARGVNPNVPGIFVGAVTVALGEVIMKDANSFDEAYVPYISHTVGVVAMVGGGITLLWNLNNYLYPHDRNR